MASLTKRGKVYYVRYWAGKKQRRVCLHTKSYAVAKEKVREIESSMARGADPPLPSKTPISKVVSAYIAAMHATKTKNTVKSELYYLRPLLFGLLAFALQPLKIHFARPYIRRYREQTGAGIPFPSAPDSLS